MPKVTPDQPCSCHRRLGALTPEFHDWLLGIEGAGLAGAVQLMQHCDLSADMEHGAGTVHWTELEMFVACHNWRDPVLMYELAELIVQALTVRTKFVRESTRDLTGV